MHSQLNRSQMHSLWDHRLVMSDCCYQFLLNTVHSNVAQNQLLNTKILTRVYNLWYLGLLLFSAFLLKITRLGYPHIYLRTPQFECKYVLKPVLRAIDVQVSWVFTTA